VAHVEAIERALLAALDRHTVPLAIHDRVIALGVAAGEQAGAAHGLGELFPWRHRWPLLGLHVLGLPAFELRQVGTRADIPGLRGLVPKRAGGLGRVALLVGHGQVLAGLLGLLRGFCASPWASGAGWARTRLYGRRSGSLRPFGEGGGIGARRHVPGLLLPIPTRPEALGFVLFLVRHVDVLPFGLLGLRLRLLPLAFLALQLGRAALRVAVVEHGRRLGGLACLFSG
jgi:hypothetical protein